MFGRDELLRIFFWEMYKNVTMTTLIVKWQLTKISVTINEIFIMIYYIHSLIGSRCFFWNRERNQTLHFRCGENILRKETLYIVHTDGIMISIFKEIRPRSRTPAESSRLEHGCSIFTSGINQFSVCRANVTLLGNIDSPSRISVMRLEMEVCS